MERDRGLPPAEPSCRVQSLSGERPACRDVPHAEQHLPVPPAGAPPGCGAVEPEAILTLTRTLTLTLILTLTLTLTLTLAPTLALTLTYP